MTLIHNLPVQNNSNINVNFTLIGSQNPNDWLGAIKSFLIPSNYIDWFNIGHIDRILESTK